MRWVCKRNKVFIACVVVTCTCSFMEGYNSEFVSMFVCYDVNL